MAKLFNFFKDESGAVTVDWVVLTAAVVITAAVAYVSVQDGAVDLTAKTETYLNKRDPNAQP